MFAANNYCHSAFVLGLFYVLLSSCDANIMLTPRILVKKVGDSAMFTCSKGDTDIDELNFYDPENSVITQSENFQLEDNGDSITLLFVNLRLKMSGTYTCKGILDDGMTVSSSSELLVHKKIQFTNTSLKEQSESVGHDALIKCTARSVPKATISWRFNKTKVENSSKYEINKEGLKIFNVSKDDSGHYQCRAAISTRDISDVKNHDINFSVHFPPKCAENYTHNYVYLKGVANLTCESTGLPTPAFTWLFNGRTIDSGPGYVVVSTENSSNLRVNMNEPWMFGEYTCNVLNSVGSCTTIINVTVAEKPGVPKVVTITSDAEGTLKLVVKPPIIPMENPDMEVNFLNIKAQYKRDNETWEKAKIVEYVYGNSPYLIKKLEHSTKYVVRVAISSAAGYGDYSAAAVQQVRGKPPSGSIKPTPMFSIFYFFIIATIASYYS